MTGWGIDLVNCDIEWFALETNRDHSVIFEIAPKNCILNSFVDYDDYFISSKGFLPTIVDREDKKELKSLLMKVKEESEKACLKLNFRKLRSWHPVPSFHGKQMRNNGNSERLYCLGV